MNLCSTKIGRREDLVGDEIMYKQDARAGRHNRGISAMEALPLLMPKSSRQRK